MKFYMKRSASELYAGQNNYKVGLKFKVTYLSKYV